MSETKPTDDEVEFTCPQCGSHLYGSSNCNAATHEEMTGHCHGGPCSFSWSRADDAKYFVVSKRKPAQPAMPEWRSSNPLHDLVARKHANIVILRPALTGHHYDAGTGYCEMKHGWHIDTHFTGESGRLIEDWDPDWLWCLAPEKKP